MINAVYRMEEKLLLLVRESHEIFGIFVCFYGWILGYDSSSRARRVQEHTIEASTYFGESFGVEIGHYGIFDAQSVYISD